MKRERPMSAEQRMTSALGCLLAAVGILAVLAGYAAHWLWEQLA